MSDIYIIWRTCYMEEGQNYHDYLVWLAATWLDYSQLPGVPDNGQLCNEPAIRWGFIAFVRARASTKAEAA